MATKSRTIPTQKELAERIRAMAKRAAEASAEDPRVQGVVEVPPADVDPTNEEETSINELSAQVPLEKVPSSEKADETPLTEIVKKARKIAQDVAALNKQMPNEGAPTEKKSEEGLIIDDDIFSKLARFLRDNEDALEAVIPHVERAAGVKAAAEILAFAKQAREQAIEAERINLSIKAAAAQADEILSRMTPQEKIAAIAQINAAEQAAIAQQIEQVKQAVATLPPEKQIEFYKVAAVHAQALQTLPEDEAIQYKAGAAIAEEAIEKGDPALAPGAEVTGGTPMISELEAVLAQMVQAGTIPPELASAIMEQVVISMQQQLANSEENNIPANSDITNNPNATQQVPSPLPEPEPTPEQLQQEMAV